MRSRRERGPDGTVEGLGRAASGLVFLVGFGLSLGLYLRTLAPTIYGLDSAELTTAAASGGLMRATGYPLYLLLGRLWSLLPFADVGFGFNLLSALCGSLTIGLLALLLTRHFGISRLATFGALGLLASAKYFWAMSSLAEVYTLQTALFAVTLMLFLRWRLRPDWRRLATATLVLGLSAGNQTAAGLTVPGLALFVVASHPRVLRDARSVSGALAAGLIGLSIYLYLPLLASTEPEFNYAGRYLGDGSFLPLNLSDPAQLWWLFSGGPFKASMFGYSPAGTAVEIGRFAQELWNAFLAIGIGPGMLGLVVLWRRDRPLAGSLIAIFVAHMVFFASYRVADKSTMFLHCYVIFALWIAVGYQWMLEWAGVTRAARVILGLALVVPVLLSVLWTGPTVDLSSDRSARDNGESALALLEPEALLVSAWSLAPVVDYLQIVEGQRPDVQALNQFLLGPIEAKRLLLREASQRPTYVDRATLRWVRELPARRIGHLYRLGAAVDSGPPRRKE